MKKKTVCAVMLAVNGRKVLADEQRVKLVKKSIQLSVFVKLLNNEGKCTMHHLHHNFYNLV